MGGTSSEELYHRQEVVSTVRIRLPWLAVALGCSLISASLLRSFEPMLSRIGIVFAFLPVIMAMGGNVGTQTSTILIRGLATNKIELSNMPKFLYKELRVGALLGIIYGLSAGAVATFVLSNHNYAIGIVVFISMVCAGITAAGMGVFAPALLKRLDFDPAIASGPFVTSLNDISGILIYMSAAGLFLKYLE
jgi:magnesium transporter